MTECLNKHRLNCGVVVAGLTNKFDIFYAGMESNSPLEHILWFISNINCSIIKCIMGNNI